eukprot:820567_1
MSLKKGRSQTREQFQRFNRNSMHVKWVDKTKCEVTKTSPGYSGDAAVYGMVKFKIRDDTDDSRKHKWVFKVNKRGIGHMAIGIDNSNAQYMNECPFTRTNTLNYSYWSSGKKCKSNEKSVYSIGWDA